MPSPTHDSLIELFRDRPQLAVEVLRDLLGQDLPVTPLARAENFTFNTRPSDDIEPDLVVVLGPPPSPAHVIIVEIQKDKSKDPRQLDRYAAQAWLMLKCDATVLVVCPDARTAEHYARPIDSGLTGYRPHPRVLGPGGIPAITDPQQAAAHPELSALAVMAHGRDRKVVEAFASALAELPHDYAAKYYEHAYDMSVPEVRHLLEEIMTSTDWPVHSPFAREHYGRGMAEGKAKGKTEGRAEEAAKLVLLVMDARGLDMPDDVRARITSCTDLTLLETWAARAATAQTVHDMFDGASEQDR
ncbi:hypothetical protein GCM10027187_31240 [Streptosporangium sandarakinum]|uniref:Uncharacterized protein n=1 Tax=Streptosporangium sandarakinum TaxID=1260955 RepID=A0A852UXX5_9ACTN|nr:hypothetical protein [Streptosporangium sandarakinum]NYF38455.1 hypothetical protein [Streptosporangium sandarakinum]